MDSQTRKTKPKYEIIKEALLARIHAGDFSFDESFCTEKMLSDQYHVSRITAKRAIEDLEQQGILYRKRGVGSFVSRSLSPDSKATDTPKMISLLLPFATTQGNISEAIGSLSAVLAECGYFLSIHVTGSSSPKERTTLELLRSQNIAALVYYPKRDNIHLEKLNDFMFSGCPIVIVDKQTDCPYLNNVVCDNYDGGRQAARHLLGQGHRNIAFFTAAPLSETSSVRDRFAGFLHEMKAAGIAPDPHQLVTCCKELSDNAALSTERTPFQQKLLAMHRDGITAIILTRPYRRADFPRLPHDRSSHSGGSLPLRLRRYKCQPKPRHYLHSSGFCRNRTRSRTDSACRPQKSCRRNGKNHSSGDDRPARIVAEKSVSHFRA